jgi:hypothetical protein
VSDERETRIEMLINHSKGAMRTALLAANKAEAERALAFIAKKRGGKILSVCVRDGGYDIEFKPDRPAKPD